MLFLSNPFVILLTINAINSNLLILFISIHFVRNRFFFFGFKIEEKDRERRNFRFFFSLEWKTEPDEGGAIELK